VREMYKGVVVQLHTFLTLALDGGKCSTSPLRSFYFRGKSPPPPDRKRGRPQSQSKCGATDLTPVTYPVTSHFNDCIIPAHVFVGDGWQNASLFRVTGWFV